MKRKNVQTRAVQKINGILIAIIGVLLALIAVVTAGTVAKRGGRNPSFDTPLPAAPLAVQSAGGQQDIRIWTGMGRLRCPLKPAKGETPATVVITVTFPYNDADIAFKQELARANVTFRAETTALFASLPPSSPLLADESALKTALLSRYNALIRLAAIEALYFPDFLIIE